MKHAPQEAVHDADGGLGLGPSAKFRLELAHHLMVAMFIASIMLILNARGALGWLDSVMLHAVGSIDSKEPDHEQALPIALTIDEDQYQGEFGGQSPLKRQPLTELVRKVTNLSPRALVLDLQLEPSTQDPQAELDRLLAEAARSGVAVVLPLPLRRSPALDALSLQWMQQLCHAGVEFGSVNIRSHLGTVLRADRDPSSIALVTDKLLKTRGAASTVGGQQPTQCRAISTACAMACGGQDFGRIDQLNDSASDIVSADDSFPLRSNVLRAIDRHRVNANDQGLAQLAQMAREAGPLTLVLGGAYDQRDQFSTPIGPTSGHVIHATTLGAIDQEHSSELLAWLVDVIIGILFAFAIHWLWHWTHYEGHAFKKFHSTKCVLRRLAWLLGIWCMILYKWSLWLIPIGIVLAVIAAAPSIMDRGWWINPGPMLLGMMIDMIRIDKAATHERNFQEFFRHRTPYLIPMAAVVSAAFLQILLT